MLWLTIIPLLPLLWLWLLRPRRGRRPLPCRLFAHRGLYGGNIPENSLPAFERAVEAGCGIELDVRLTRDGQVVVCHDDSLLRMCGAEARVRDLTLAELKRLRLKESGETVPTLAEALARVDRRVPLLV